MQMLVTARKLGSNAIDFASARRPPMWVGVAIGVAGFAIAGVFVARALKRRALARAGETDHATGAVGSNKSTIKDMGKDIAKPATEPTHGGGAGSGHSFAKASRL